VDAVLDRFDYLRDARSRRVPHALTLATGVAVLAAILLVRETRLDVADRHVPRAARRFENSRLFPKIVPAASGGRRRLASMTDVRPEPQHAAGISPNHRTAFIREIVLGDLLKAVVVVDGRTIVVDPGSSLGRHLVAEIDSHGVLLDDGERLRLEATSPSNDRRE
jgi:hypothetical protein